MKILLGVFAVFAGASLAIAADLEAGRAKATTVCAACHGANGISVADAIPNLAGQRGRYIDAQLRALKDGSRKNPLMNSIAAQLSNADIADLAAYFAAQPGQPDPVQSEFLPNLAKTSVRFPENHKTFTKYMTLNFPETGQVRHFYANEAAVQAAKAGKPLPDGSFLWIEVFSAKLDAGKKPVMGGDGFFAPDRLLFYMAMERQAGWGANIPDMLRNEDWNYAVFNPGKELRPRVNHAECLACHKPLHNESFLFTLKQLSAGPGAAAGRDRLPSSSAY